VSLETGYVVHGMVNRGRRDAAGFSALAHLVGLKCLEEVSDLLFNAWRNVHGGDELWEILDRTGWGTGRASLLLRTL